MATNNNEVAVVQRGNSLPMVRPDVSEGFVTPSVDVYETPDTYVILVDLPGASKDSISLSLERGALVLKASVTPYHGQNATLLYSELRTTTYYRVFNLGNGIDRRNIEAQFERGVLTAKLYKSAEMRPKEIQIK